MSQIKIKFKKKKQEPIVETSSENVENQLDENNIVSVDENVENDENNLNSKN